jgi:hypothetical protein
VPAQENLTSSSSSISDSARFEVVQSPILAKLTIRLDRFTGDSWQFVTTEKGGFTWQPLSRGNEAGDVKVPNKVNYQIFLSGIRAQITVLMNVNTGATWYIATDPKEGEFWSPIQ